MRLRSGRDTTQTSTSNKAASRRKTRTKANAGGKEKDKSKTQSESESGDDANRGDEANELQIEPAPSEKEKQKEKGDERLTWIWIASCCVVGFCVLLYRIQYHNDNLPYSYHNLPPPAPSAPNQPQIQPNPEPAPQHDLSTRAFSLLQDDDDDPLTAFSALHSGRGATASTAQRDWEMEMDEGKGGWVEFSVQGFRGEVEVVELTEGVV
ncbi:uncharacterized protein J3D65DRAFT_605992 [Phyllosticta citribraziliensis]|uniref:Uncharacterized protein n=1 Tax=Phyllosticta citribraziliensis TaxID=989973 RepID=A0ABR1L9V5_9PEZI